MPVPIPLLIIPVCSTLAGGLLAVRFRHLKDMLIACGAGLLLGAAFLELMPEAIDLAEQAGISPGQVLSLTLVSLLRKEWTAFPEWLEQDGPSGELVVQNGDDIEELIRPASWYLFDHTILYPTIGLLPAHLPYTLAQRGVLRLEDTIQAIGDLLRVLDDDRFRNSPFSECRDEKKPRNLRWAWLLCAHQPQRVRKISISWVCFLNDKN